MTNFTGRYRTGDGQAYETDLRVVVLETYIRVLVTWLPAGLGWIKENTRIEKMLPLLPFLALGALLMDVLLAKRWGLASTGQALQHPPGVRVSPARSQLCCRDLLQLESRVLFTSTGSLQTHRPPLSPLFHPVSVPCMEEKSLVGC